MIFKLLDVNSALQNRFERVLGQNFKIYTTDPKKLAISENFANSEILQILPSKILLIAKASDFPSFSKVRLAHFRAGGAFRSLSINVLQLYNPKTTSRQCT
jgi:hypothetical protein